MTTRVWLAMAAAAAALIVGFEVGQAGAASNEPPIVNGGSLTVSYEDTYSVHFTASDPEGAALTLVAPPTNEDWLGCDGGPPTDFTCDYSSSRYYDPAPLPTAPFQRTITYSVTDGVSTSTGEWNVTVLPPPTMQITGNVTVTEGGEALLHLELSSNTYGSMIVIGHLIDEDTADDAVDPLATFAIDIADGQTTAEVRVPIPDDAVGQPLRHLTASVGRDDAIPYRFVPGGNRVTVLDNDAEVPVDTAPPTIAAHRDLTVQRGGNRPAHVFFSPPAASDDVDGTISTVCVPGPLSEMAVGHTKVACSATDASGNATERSFKVKVRKVSASGLKDLFGRHGEHQCVVPGQVVSVFAEGFAAGATVTMFVQTKDLDIVPLPTTTADRKGRIRQVVTIPVAAAGAADVVVVGPAGSADLMRMIPIRIGDDPGQRSDHHHHHHRWNHWVRTLSFPTRSGC